MAVGITVCCLCKAIVYFRTSGCHIYGTVEERNSHGTTNANTLILTLILTLIVY